VRLARLAVEGFRGLASATEIDLDANAIIVIGANGQGKTSIFDAVLWGLTGTIPRLGDDPEVVCLYSASGQARVEIELRGEDGLVRVIRSHDGARSRLTLELGGQSFRDDGAESRLHEVLWPDSVFAPDANSTLTTTLTRSVYLQQDVVGQFIDGDSPRERFEAVSELVGAGRVTELTLSLESAKRAWSAQTNRQDQELESLRTRLAEVQARLDSLSSLGDVDQAAIADQWGSWWLRASQIEDVVEGDIPEAPSAEAPAALELAVKRLDVRRLAVGRRVSRAEELDAEIEERAEAVKVAHDPAELAKQAEVVEAQLGRLNEALAAAEEEAAEQRRRQVERREREEELRALAELAIRHLEGACPVCGQEHDAEKTKRHLEELVGAGADEERPSTSQEAGAVNALATEVERTRLELSETRSKLSEAEAEARAREQWEAERARRLAELEISATDTASAHVELRKLAGKLRGSLEEIDALQAEGERLALAVAGLGERARRGEYEDQVKRTEAELGSKEAAIEARRQSGERAGRILEALREASSSVVAAQLRRVEPLLQRIYATVDPHPSLRDISLALSVSRGRGHLDTPLDDAQRPVSASLPGAILSSSQLNALAVSVFLALNLGVPTIPLGAAMLDDPLQSLDDVNLLGLIDLLRRTKDRRQLIVSTHDSRFGRLLARKLRPVSPDQRTLVITLSGWGREGPTITQGESPRDSEIIRIAA
jgi:DNA repair exonuclease SbcCD ATPase subunit